MIFVAVLLAECLRLTTLSATDDAALNVNPSGAQASMR
jgi:hypothetical protein